MCVSALRVMLIRVIAVFEAELWIWDARRADTWTFVSLPADVSDEIEALADRSTHGFGSVPVRVTIGGTTWTTSVFPDRGRGCYVLPVKKAVRNAERVDIGDVATVKVEVMGL